MGGKPLEAPTKYLKECQEDLSAGQVNPLFWHRRTEIELEAEPTEGTVEAILDHRLVGGRPQFLVQWGENGEQS